MSGHDVQVRCSDIIGVPNSEATCSCGASASYFPGQAKREGYPDDYQAATAWAKAHAAKENLS